ncbi:MAG: HD domain-containing protein [Lachnospiraceae bacterium]|nr:HD domain-containing protein [Lachnospiraceae bacterium]
MGEKSEKTEKTGVKKVSYKKIRKSREVNLLIDRGNEILGILGYTEHSQVHATLVASRAAWLLKELGYPEHVAELARIAGYMHDIGNSINRHDHAHSGAILAYGILKDMKMELTDAIIISSAIGQHDESTGTAIDAVSAALIIADKTDVRRNRVRNRIRENFDAHDRVNYAVLSTKLSVIREKKMIQMDMELDDRICSVMDYFEIFLQRMVMCRRASEILGFRFRLVVNGNKLA